MEPDVAVGDAVYNADAVVVAEQPYSDVVAVATLVAGQQAPVVVDLAACRLVVGLVVELECLQAGLADLELVV